MNMDGVKVIEYEDGTKRWFKNGEPHREDGPAVECANGDKYWCKDGKYHRIGGPAIELANGEKQWWLNGKHYGVSVPAIEHENNESGSQVGVLGPVPSTGGVTLHDLVHRW